MAKKTAKKTNKTETKKSAASELPPARSKKVSMSVCVTADDLSDEAKKLIARADEIEVQLADLTDEFQTVLKDICIAIDGRSFEHPDRGDMTVMSKGDKLFWRQKPAGDFGRTKGKKKAA